MASTYFLIPAIRQRTGGFEHRAAIVEDILHGRTDLVGRDGHDLVDVLPRDTERLLARLAYGDTVRENTDLGQLDAPAMLQRLVHAWRFVRLDADYPGCRAQCLHGERDTGNQTSATDRHEDGMYVVLVLTQDFQSDRALPGDHLRIVIGMDECHTLLLCMLRGELVGLVVGVAMQFDLCTVVPDRLDLDGRRGARHYDQCLHVKTTCSQRHTLCVVAG